MEDVVIKNVDSDVKRKASYVAKVKGSNLSALVREILEQQAKEFDKMIK